MPELVSLAVVTWHMDVLPESCHIDSLTNITRIVSLVPHGHLTRVSRDCTRESAVLCAVTSTVAQERWQSWNSLSLPVMGERLRSGMSGPASPTAWEILTGNLLVQECTLSLSLLQPLGLSSFFCFSNLRSNLTVEARQGRTPQWAPSHSPTTKFKQPETVDGNGHCTRFGKVHSVVMKQSYLLLICQSMLRKGSK